MKTRLRTLLVGLALLSTLNPQLSTVLAQGTAFTYQGRLTDGPDTATGIYDLSFSLFAASSGGAPVSGPLTTNSVAVSNGLFTVTLDFGTSAFPGADRFLEIGARTNGGGAFTTLTPRQKLTATPYAVMARNITGVVPSTSLSGTYSSAVTLNSAGNSFTGNGAGLTGVNAATLGGLNANQFWRTAGNSGTTAANFVGTTDNQPLEMRVNGQRAFRLQPNSGAAPTIIGGSNTVGALLVNGAVIAGGEMNLIENFGSFSTVSGGVSNQILGAQYATIAGGHNNLIQSGGFYSTIGGGKDNFLDFSAQQVVIAGGIQNRMERDANSSAIGGGFRNVIHSNTVHSVIAGGHTNSIGPLVSYSAIGGGNENSIQSRADYSVIGGGRRNRIQSSNEYAVIAGGEFNVVAPNCNYSIIGGGQNNVISNAVYATVPGGGANVAGGDFSFAAGRQARALHDGSFVWADASALTPFGSTTNNQFLIRAAGGVGIGTTNPIFTLHVNGEAGKPGGGSWSVASDERLKKNIRPLAGALDKLLALHGVNFEYIDPAKVHELSGERMGLVAQEVESVFPDWVETGPDGYKRVTVRGLEALVVEALRELQQKQDAKNEKLADELKRRDAENAELKRSVEDLKTLVEALARKSEGGVR